MAVRRVDLGIADLALVVQQGLDDFAAALGRKAPVGAEADDQKFAGRAGQRQAQIAAVVARRVKVIQRPGDEQIGIGIKVLGELVTLVAQIAFDLKFGLLGAEEIRRQLFGTPLLDGLRGGAQLAAELLVHHIVAQIGDVANHAGNAQTAFGDYAVVVEVAAMEVRVGHDGAARHFVKGDVFGVQVRGAGNYQGVAHALRVTQGPAQGLHAAQRAAHHCGQFGYTQHVQQACLGVHPVLHRHHWEVGAVGPAGCRIGVHGAGGAKAGAQVVDANDKEAFGIQRLAGANHVVPPAFGVGLAHIDTGHVVRGIECMANQHGVGLVGIQAAVGLVAEMVVRQGSAALQRQRSCEVHALCSGNQWRVQARSHPKPLNKKTRRRIQRGRELGSVRL